MKKTLIATLLASFTFAPAAFAEMVNINKADVATLSSLDGIGEKKAEAIVAYRTEHGEFKTLEDLKAVPGIGDKLFEKIKPELSLTEDATTTDGKTPTAKAETKTDKAAETTEAKKSETTEKAVGTTEAKKPETTDKAVGTTEAKKPEITEKVSEKAKKADNNT